MPAHVDFVSLFDRAVRGGALPPGVTASEPEEAERRFAVYRNNVVVGLTDALASRFPAIRRLVGDEFFAAMARVYAETDRPRSPVLSEWGEGFAPFLAAFPPLARYPYMADVARIEFARGCAFHAADVESLAPVDLAGADPNTLHLALHPSVKVLKLGTAAVSIWAANQPGARPAPLPTDPETALVLRDRTLDVPVRAIGPGDAGLIAALGMGQTWADAALCAQQADPGHDPGPILLHLMQAGAFVQERTK